MTGEMTMTCRSTEQTDKVYAEWKYYIASEIIENTDVRPEVIDSWVRCSNHRVDPFSLQIHRTLSAKDLQKTLSDNRKLIALAHPFMENLYHFVKGSGFVVVLTDPMGYILEAFGDEDAMKAPLTQNFYQGASWREEDAGTNAIGTAVELKAPVQVSGSEHFCSRHHCLTCSAAPIFDTEGTLLGILDISGAFESSHLHTLGMVVAAAEAIMAQLRIRNQNYQLVAANKKLISFFNMVSDGVLIVDLEGAVLEMNPAAEKILGRSKNDVMGVSVTQFISAQFADSQDDLRVCKSCSDIEVIVEAAGGSCQCLASAEPIINENEVETGGFITLRPIKEVRNLVNRFSGNYASLRFEDIVGASAPIKEATRIARLSAQNRSSVLLQGESGTGKEIFAQAIHNQCCKSVAPFIALNCGAIPRELIGSELFGYEEGAFTGARQGGRPGKFELASGGTLFLDEIGDMPLEHQTVLLRVIQEKRMSRIGSDKMIPVNVRLICATNKDLLEEVRKGTFRLDLYYRLNVMSVLVPPLRDRIEDIPLLFKYFLERLSRDMGRKIIVDLDVMDCLMGYSWPGNVRELQNTVERALNLAENGVISIEQLPPDIVGAKSVRPVLTIQESSGERVNRQQRQQVRKDTDKNTLLNLLNVYAGNISQVAKEMGVSRKTVYNKMKDLSIEN